MANAIIIGWLTALVAIAYALVRLTFPDRRIPAHTSPRDHHARPQRMALQEQWKRVTSVIELSLARSAKICIANAAAATQLGAAEYTLHGLLTELSSVMELPISSPLQLRTAIAPANARLRSAIAA